MTDPNHIASTDAELTIKIQLGSQIIAYRPAARTETGPEWVRIDEDTDIGILTDGSCRLRVRLVAYDRADEPLGSPPWTVRASTQAPAGIWKALYDRSEAEVDFLTDAHEVIDTKRNYRFQVGLQGTTLASTFDLAVSRQDPAPADDDDDDHDILFDPDGDLKPPLEPVTGGQGRSPAGTLIASG